MLTILNFKFDYVPVKLMEVSKVTYVGRYLPITASWRVGSLRPTQFTLVFPFVSPDIDVMIYGDKDADARWTAVDIRK